MNEKIKNIINNQYVQTIAKEVVGVVAITAAILITTALVNTGVDMIKDHYLNDPVKDIQEGI